MTRTIARLGLLACLACSPARREGEEAVRHYNEVVVAAYGQNDPSHLREVAVAKEARKIAALVDLKKESQVVLESKLLRLEVKDVKRPGNDRMTVATEERWRYHDRPIAPGALPGPEFLADMKVEYELLQEEGRWKVRSVTVPWNQYYDPDTEKPIPRPDFEPKRGSGLAHQAPARTAPPAAP
ncbi:hypothetical protein [Anaeromyxobacter paludicola]|uniref:Lipoprotein n=1 Tax=Anaeromyxobacter paludicola TaxID=2918171 RepID=A0ABN6N5T3_9BACT|nr:hypothetical protein [Anaeromyxobacter paludicola]BDG07365.1 hypothetical protein AMPC_04780 [Anaeromyxobacter paludicola]